MGAVIKKNPKKENLDNNTQQKLRKHKKSILRIVESPIPGLILLPLFFLKSKLKESLRNK